VNIARQPPLRDADEEAARAAIIAKLEADPGRYLSEYTHRFGNVLNADSAATLFPEYNESPAKYRVAVHPAAQWIRDELFQRALENAPPELFRVVFTAGGNAAGKSTALIFSGADSQSAAAVLDSTFSNERHATGLINLAINAGRHVTIIYVNRPLDDALNAMLERADVEGRVVTLHQLIESQRGAADTVRKLWDRYCDRTDFTFQDYGRAVLKSPNRQRTLKADMSSMESLTPNTALDASRPLSTRESKDEANRRFANIEAARIVVGMNRLRQRKNAEKSARLKEPTQPTASV